MTANLIKHSPYEISTDLDHQFITEFEREYWNNKSDYDHSHTELEECLVSLRGTTYDSLSSRLDSIDDSINKVNQDVLNSSVVDSSLLGFKPLEGYDNTKILRKLIDSGFKGTIQFGSGYYEFSEYCIQSSDIHLRGEVSPLKGGSSLVDTVFCPHTDNQDYVLKVGGSVSIFESRVENVSVYDISIRDTIIESSGSVIYRPVSVALLVCEYAVSCKFSLSFKDIRSRCIYIRNSWELYFDTISIRKSYYTNYSILIDTPDNDNVSNNSSIVINLLDAEEFAYGILTSTKNSLLSNILISNILLEINPTMYTKSIIDSIDKYYECTKLPLFKLDYCEGLTVNSINIARLNTERFKLTLSSDKYTVFSLFHCDWLYNISVSNINMNCNSTIVDIISGDGDSRSCLSVGSITTTKYNKLVGSSSIISTPIEYTVKRGVVNISSTNTTALNTQLSPGTYSGSKLYDIFLQYSSMNSIQYNREFSSNYGYTKYDKSTYVTLTSNIYFNTDSLMCIRLNTTGSILVMEDGKVLDTLLPTTGFEVRSLRIPGGSNITMKLSDGSSSLLIDYVTIEDDVNPTLQSGSINITTENTPVRVYYPKPYKATPVVVVTGLGGVPYKVSTAGVSSDSFEVISELPNRTIHWISVGK